LAFWSIWNWLSLVLGESLGFQDFFFDKQIRGTLVQNLLLKTLSMSISLSTELTDAANFGPMGQLWNELDHICLFVIELYIIKVYPTMTMRDMNLWVSQIHFHFFIRSFYFFSILI
jgi:hypothetical protein